ncbi:laminin subunit gamma-3 [Eublepharis macularius]|uniref:Laminin subunit gamma-3 n=1 Tax=Eublepharis macularius TaxID=481883 RepID=A0AA97LIK3_EUBMA|nr:laminin subunit gamma-3 [Eublepharis macularius]
MAEVLCFLTIVFLELQLAIAGMDSCYNAQGLAQRCMPIFENAAFGKQVQVSNTCGTPPEDYCLQMGTRDSSTPCHRCDAGEALLHHNATHLTDFHSQEESTWWQSQSMAFGIQHPNSVNITLHLGKSYEITYVRLKFHTSRPESFAIYKRSHSEGPWIPYQYYSASCNKTYGKPERHFLRPGEDEQVAFCTAEFSDISPLNGGNVAFSTLEGRPSAYSFDKSPVLQEWVTGTDLLISLNRLNTFGDDIFKDPKVLQSYYYAISDFSVGGRCKCNGHANTCIPNEEDELICLCQHNTTGVDCDSCQPFYQDRPWARGTAESANECLPCNCSGRSSECFYDWELYRRTGHGGHCQNCQDNTDGPHCERCRQNFYRWDARMACQPCNCNPTGSLSPQCDSSGACECKATVTGWKCERCQEGFHSLSEGGCRPCACDTAGSVGVCDPNTGHCTCKEKVEGYLCNRCQPGTFNLQPHDPAGCTGCFCFGHSVACTVASGYEMYNIISDFSQGLEGWRMETPEGLRVPLSWTEGETFLEQGQWAAADFLAPEKFLHDQRLSYGQLLSVLFRTHDSTPATQQPIWLVLEGEGIMVSARYSNMDGQVNNTHHEEQTVTFRLHETEKEMQPTLSAFQFQRLLSNLTALRIRTESSGRQGRLSLKEVRLTSARPGLSQPALWVEECICPHGYMGQFCESCAPNFKREIPFAGPFTSCIPCSCNEHGSCDPNTGLCQCLHNTEGPSCERCAPGFHGDPFLGRSDDCKPCPCPGQTPCTALPESGEVVCTQCPPGQRGRLCELCDDGFFGDPLGRNGPIRPCVPCTCNDNVDPNAVGNCDPVSGQCLRCLYNTAGEQCERCQEGFYGDPLANSPARKCAACSCNHEGSIHSPEACHNVTGQCPCLPHVTGKDCSQCQEGYYALQAGIGCKSCNCHPAGSQHSHCHPLTGQCVCRSGVEGLSCDRCQTGFFGFSFQGCRACNCSRLGSVSLQCHENSTCLCKRGFVGYKCDQCEENYFFDPETSQCKECPICYGLVKEEADKLTDQLVTMESWLQKPDCGRHKTRYGMLREAPRGDSIHSRYLREGAKATFLEEAEELASSISRARSRLKNIRGVMGCNSSVATKSCILLSDILSALQSTQQEIQLATEMLAAQEFPSEISHQPTNWSHQALTSKLLARGHGEAAALVEGIARKALETTNASYLLLQSILMDNATLEFRRQMEARYLGILKAQQELSSEMEEATAKKTFASIQQINLEMSKNLSWITTLELDPVVEEAEALWHLILQRPLLQRAENLLQDAKEVERLAESKAQLVVNGSLAAQAGLEKELQRMQQVEQLWQRANAAHLWAASSLSNGEAVVSEAKNLLSSLDGMKRHKGGQSLMKRRVTVVRERVIADAQKKARQAKRVLGDSASVSAKAQKTAKEVESLTEEDAKKVQAVFRDAKAENKRSSQLTTRVDLTMAEIVRQEEVSEALGRKQEGPGQVGMETKDLDKSLRDAQRSLERDIEALNNLLLSLGNLDRTSQTEAALNASQFQLERLQLHLAEPRALGQKLSALQQEAEQQQQRIEAFEKDLEEIRSDKENLETILHSLPEQCSSWQ